MLVIFVIKSVIHAAQTKPRVLRDKKHIRDMVWDIVSISKNTLFLHARRECRHPTSILHANTQVLGIRTLVVAKRVKVRT